MIRKTLNSSPFIVLLMIDLFVMILSFVVFYLIGGGIVLKLFGLKLNFNELIATNNLNVIRWLLIWYSITLFMLPAIIIAWIFAGRKWYNYLKLKYNLDGLAIIIIIFLTLDAQIITNLLSTINSKLQLPEKLSYLETILKQLENQTEHFLKTILYTTNLNHLILNLIAIALLPAISEELLFRGVIQTQLHQKIKNYHIAILISAFIFAFAHFQFYTFLPRLLLGILLGYLFYFLNSIWANILFHFINNSLGVLLFYYLAKNNLPPQFAIKPEYFSIPWYTYLLSFVILILLLLILKSYKPKY